MMSPTNNILRVFCHYRQLVLYKLSELDRHTNKDTRRCVS